MQGGNAAETLNIKFPYTPAPQKIKFPENYSHNVSHLFFPNKLLSYKAITSTKILSYALLIAGFASKNTFAAAPICIIL